MYVGLDVAKNKSNVCVLDKNLKIIKELEIKHDKNGFEELEKHITKDMIMGLETTGNYCKIIYKHFLNKGYNVTYVDNVQMKNFARLNSPTIKNDVVDARLIAKFLNYDYKRINPIRVDELKDLVKLHHKITIQLSRFRIMFKEQTNIIFPEIEEISGLNRTRGMQNLLLKYPSPNEIEKLSPDKILNLLTENLNASGPYNLEFANKVKQIAANSVGVKDFPVTSYQYTNKILQFYQDIIEEIKDRMLMKLMQTPYYKLLDIMDYNVTCLSKIVGEVGDIRRFKNHKKFVSYCGLGVTEKQSGTMKSVNCHITRRGNRILRFTFYVLALLQIRHKHAIYPFYKRLKDKGKHSKQAITACGRKIAVWTYHEMRKCHE